MGCLSFWVYKGAFYCNSFICNIHHEISSISIYFKVVFFLYRWYRKNKVLFTALSYLNPKKYKSNFTNMHSFLFLFHSNVRGYNPLRNSYFHCLVLGSNFMLHIWNWVTLSNLWNRLTLCASKRVLMSKLVQRWQIFCC